MCIIIDANTLVPVFSGACEKHEEFAPVLDWIIRGKGKMVYGGSKYKQELRKVKKYRRLLLELRKGRKLVVLDEDEVDRKQAEIESIISHRDFDDPHIIAIVLLSGCKLICSGDKRAYRFFTDKVFYPKHFERPKIYSGCRNEDLLCDRNIADICRPCDKLSKAVVEVLQESI